MWKRLIWTVSILTFIILLSVNQNTISPSESLLEGLARKNRTMKDLFVYKVESLDPSFMGIVSYELYGASGKHYYLGVPEGFVIEGRTRPPKVCTIEEAIDMIEGAMITGRHGWSREITNYEDFKAVDDFLRTCKFYQIQQYFYAIVEFSARLVDYSLVDYSAMTLEERNVIHLENKTKIDRRWMSFMFYDVERDRVWIEENIIFYQ